MPGAHSIRHKMKNQVWTRPEISYDSWAKINDFARKNKMDFPSAVEVAAGLLTDSDVIELARRRRVNIVTAYHDSVIAYKNRLEGVNRGVYDQ